MAKYAIIKNNIVINSCVWDGLTEWQPTEGDQVVEMPENVGIGYEYNNGQFIPPAQVITQPVEEDPLANLTTEQIQALIALLNSKVS